MSIQSVEMPQANVIRAGLIGFVRWWPWLHSAARSCNSLIIGVHEKNTVMDF